MMIDILRSRVYQNVDNLISEIRLVKPNNNDNFEILIKKLQSYNKRLNDQKRRKKKLKLLWPEIFHPKSPEGAIFDGICRGNKKINNLYLIIQYDTEELNKWIIPEDFVIKDITNRIDENLNDLINGIELQRSNSTTKDFLSKLKSISLRLNQDQLDNKHIKIFWSDFFNLKLPDGAKLYDWSQDDKHLYNLFQLICYDTKEIKKRIISDKYY